ncbi:MAG TPA: hypothetical protein VKL40_13065 [Candidatus Angelobacter sp.]|nr:hypothetical protein [Candidatus Angelobacter sp.]
MTTAAPSEKVAARAGIVALPGRERSGGMIRILLPSLTDILFLSLLCATYGILGQRLLADSDIGWHIRNGEHMFATGSVPQADYFSYTMTGRPWYAWEWLYDAIIAGIHHLAGLNGVVLFSAAIFAFTFTLLFRLAWRGSRSVPLAFCLTLLAAAAASIHLLARPHLLTWLFTLIWFDRLNNFQRGQARHLLALPLLMPVWANLHGGFLIGIVLQALFLAANLWTSVTTSSQLRRSLARRRLRHLSVVLLLTLAATLITPYGYRLYLHLHGYLGDTYLMDHILEFLSPNFHLFQVKAFALLLMVVLMAVALTGRTVRMLDIVIVAFAAWAGLYAARNIPLAAILLTITISPWLGAALRRMPGRTDIAIAWRRLAGKADGLSARMGAMEERLAGHAWPAMILGLLIFTAPAASSRKATMIAFNDKQVPARAVEYMAGHNIRDHFFSPDFWGGYLIYRLYPNVRLMVDDRHDFYGAPFVRDYLTMLQVGPGWRNLLDGNQVNWVLAPCDSSLANALKAVPDWRVIHEDETAVIFERTVPLEFTSTTGWSRPSGLR